MNNKAEKKKKNTIENYIGCGQNIGKRGEQQDSFGICDIYDEELLRESGMVAVLADGMGGLEGGREASQTAVDIAIRTYENKAVSEKIIDALIRAVYLANEEIYNIADRKDIYGNMGTTIIAVAVHNSKFYWVSVGDSILYFMRDGILKKLNNEHNYGNKLDDAVLRGDISWEYAQNQPERHHLTSFLGLDEIEELDYSKQPIVLKENDVILVCSDGLTNTLSRQEIRRIVDCKQTSFQDIADNLIISALNKDEEFQDNITVVLLGADGFIEPKSKKTTKKRRM